jgi:hypothetical protein
MYDLAEPNAEPGPCRKCHGTGLYQWGTQEIEQWGLASRPCACRPTRQPPG